MDTARALRLQQEFQDSRGCSDAEFGSRVARLRATDPALADDLVALRRDYEAALSSNGDGPALQQWLQSRTLGGALTDPQRFEGLGDALGLDAGAVPGFLLLRKLGQGGMGVVFEAEQQSPRRRVALKLMQPSLGAGRERRFALEAAVLARLHHPNIAQLYSYGTCRSAHGEQPYFAMELIDGVDLRTHATRAGLAVAAQLELVAQVLDGIHHAHECGIVHRDLKPDNVLVDGNGTPKVLDFGVARAADSSIDVVGGATQTGDVIGTLAYMAPEQLAGDLTAISPRTDVYSLGVMLYELLCSRLPHEVTGLPIGAAIALLRSHVPAPVWRHRPALAGDIATIVGKAMEPDPRARYVSAQAMAADIRRHLDHLPILARPASTWYQARKFVRRHRVQVLAVGAVFLSLAAGLLLFAWQAQVARRERDEADRARRVAIEERGRAVEAQRLAQEEKAKAEASAAETEKFWAVQNAVVEFQQGILTAAGPRSMGAEVTVAAAIGAAIDQIERGALAGQPEVEAGVRDAIGATMHELARPAEAEQQLQRALALQRRARPEGHISTAVTLLRLGLVHADQGRDSAAEPLFREAIAMLRATKGTNTTIRRALSRGLQYLAIVHVHRGETTAAEGLMQEALALHRAEPSPPPERTAGLLDDQAKVLVAQGRLAEAEALQREALSLRRTCFGPAHATIAMSLQSLGHVLFRQRKFGDAEPLYREALAASRGTYPDGHPEIGRALNALGAAIVEQGRHQEAEPLLREALAILRTALPAVHHDTAVVLWGLGLCSDLQGEKDEAERFYREAWAMDRATAGVGHPSNAGNLALLGQLLWARGKLDESIPIFEELVQTQLASHGRTHPKTLLQLANLGVNYKDAGRLAEALPLLEEVHRAASKEASLSWVAGPLLQVCHRLADRGQPETIDRAVKVLWEYLRVERAARPPSAPGMAERLEAWAPAALGWHAFADAERMLREALAIRESIDPAGWAVFPVRAWLGRALLGQGRLDDAEKLLLGGYQGLLEHEAELPAGATFLEQALEGLVQLAEARGDASQAAAFRVKLDEAKARAKAKAR